MKGSWAILGPRGKVLGPPRVCSVGLGGMRGAGGGGWGFRV